MKKILLSISILLAVNATQAQSNSSLTERGDIRFKELAFSDALPFYEAALKKEQSNKAYLHSKIANCYRLLGDFQKAAENFGLALKSGAIEGIDYLYYGMSLESTGDYSRAEQVYEQFLKAFPGDNRGMLRLASVQSANSLAKLPETSIVTAVNVNSSRSDFGPTITSDGLLFASNRNQNQAFSYTDKWTGSVYYDVFEAKSNQLMGFEQPRELGSYINTPYHESNVAFAPGNQLMVFTRSQTEPNGLRNSVSPSNIDNVVKLKLMVSAKKEGGKWSDAVDFPYSDANYSFAHPSFAPDGSALFFSSDRPGGFGGADIWKCPILADGSFGAPQNLGPGINTAGQEMFPFVGDDNNLFFASNGLPGFGGLDLFRAAKNPDSEVYDGASNLGKPLNSTYDDFALSNLAGQFRGYFTSNRPGGAGEDDIYGFTLSAAFLHLTIIDAATGAPVPYASIQSQELNLAAANGLGIAAAPVELNKDYTIVVSAKGYRTKSIVLDSRNWPNGYTEFRTIPLECAGDNKLGGLVLDLKTKLPLNKATVTIKNSITGSEDQFVTGPNGEYSVPFCPSLSYILAAEKQGFSDTSEIFDATGLTEPSPRKNLYLQGGMVDNLIRFYEIYFDYDKYKLRPTASNDLKIMLELLNNNPEWRVEIAAHTDSRGRDAYNQRLSERRAESVVNYLIARGIAPNRLVARGFGETKPTNRCVDGVNCNEIEHQANRRIEFRLIDSNDKVIEMSLPKDGEEVFN
ncbi:MAG TPA: OmpA family protein [Luteibaculaceae bacterium]|nr:OmpA family protein [Luteibaculaceae bacterium]